MKSKILAVIIWLLLLAVTSTTVAAEGMVVHGDQSIRSELERLYRDAVKSGYADSAIGPKLISSLMDRGYLDATFSRDSGHFVVVTGQQATLHSIVEQGRTNSALIVDRAFTAENLKTGLNGLLRPYRDSGYLYSRASVQSVERTGNTLTVTASIAAGPIVKTKVITYVGLERTKPELINRWLRFDTGTVVTDALLRRLSDRAASIPFTEFSAPIVVKPLAGYNEAILQMNFREKRQFLIDGGAGYDPDQSQGLVWSLNLKLQNLFGSGRDISVLSARRQTGNDLLDIGYSQPIFVLGVGDAHGRFMTRNYQNQFYEFSAVAGLNSAFRPGQLVGVDLGWKRVDPEFGLSYHSYDATVDYSLDRIDRYSGAETGFRFASSIGYLFRSYNPDSLGSGSTYNDTRAEFDASLGQKLWRGWTVWSRVYYQGIESKQDTLPLSELYFVGGPGTLRGFRTDQFIVQRAVIGTFEPRVAFPSGYLFGFGDAAYLNLGIAGGVGKEELFKFGYGLGATIADQNRSVSISFGWNKELSIDQPQLAIRVISVL